MNNMGIKWKSIWIKTESRICPWERYTKLTFPVISLSLSCSLLSNNTISVMILEYSDSSLAEEFCPGCAICPKHNSRLFCLNSEDIASGKGLPWPTVSYAAPPLPSHHLWFSSQQLTQSEMISAIQDFVYCLGYIFPKNKIISRIRSLFCSLL